MQIKKMSDQLQIILFKIRFVKNIKKRFILTFLYLFGKLNDNYIVKMLIC